MTVTAEPNGAEGADHSSDADRDPTERRDPWPIATLAAALVLVGLAVWPVLEAGRSALDLVWNPSGDWAVLTMRVEDVGRTTPLIGPYSRFGWSHPGPLSYWLLAAPYHLLGGTASSVLAAAAALNAATIAAIGTVAWRRGRLPLVAISMGAIAILLHAMGPQMLRDPWNPHLTLLPFALFVLLMWSITDGDHLVWPLVVFVASALIQTHLGYLPMVIVIAAVSILLTRQRRDPVPLLPATPTRRRVVLATSIAVLVVCWAPVLWDQLLGTGNLGAITAYWFDGAGSTVGIVDSLRLAALQLGLPDAPWLGHPEFAAGDGSILGTSLLALIVPIVAMAVAVVITRRTGARSALRFDLVVIATAASGTLATTQVVPPNFDWITRWWWVIGCLWWMAIAWSLWSALTTVIRSREARRVAATIVAAMSTLVVLQSVRPVVEASARANPPAASSSEVLANFLPQTVAALEGSGPVLVRAVGSVNGSYADAIRFDLEHHGVDVVSSSDLAYKVGEHRSIDHRTPELTLWVVSADLITEFVDDPSMHFVASWDPMTPSERAVWTIDERELQDQFIAADRVDLAEALTNGTGGVDREGSQLDGIDQVLLGRVEAGRRRGDPVAVFIGPAPD